MQASIAEVPVTHAVGNIQRLGNLDSGTPVQPKFNDLALSWRESIECRGYSLADFFRDQLVHGRLAWSNGIVHSADNVLFYSHVTELRLVEAHFFQQFVVGDSHQDTK